MRFKALTTIQAWVACATFLVAASTSAWAQTNSIEAISVSPRRSRDPP